MLARQEIVMPMAVRSLVTLLLGGLLVGPGSGITARAQAAPESTPALSCTMPLTLNLQPGLNWPGAQPQPIPDDLPPGALSVTLPLFPGAAATREQEEMPTFSYPGDPYLKSASATYEAGADLSMVMDWYRAAFAACGYSSPAGTGQSGKIGQPPLSYGIDYNRQDGRNTIFINLSFAKARDGGTLILYVVVALTPPEYPVPGSVLRVPGTPVAVGITQYAGWNPGPHVSQPTRTVDVTDASVASSLAGEINLLPKVTGTYFCPFDDNAHITLIFTDADGTQHVVRIDLRGCQFVHAPPAPLGRLFDDPKLLPRVLGLLSNNASKAVALPFDAHTLKAVDVRRLGSTHARFLSTGQSGSNLLYLSGGDLFVASAAGGPPRLLAHKIADAAFTINDAFVLARPRRSGDLTRLLLIDTRSGKSSPFALPRQISLVGRVAGAGSPGLSDAMQCNLQYVFYRVGNDFAGVDPVHPQDDRFRTHRLFPGSVPGQLVATSCSGDRIAVYQPGHGLEVLYSIGSSPGDPGRVLRRLALADVTLLAWAPDDQHLAYRVGDIVSVLDVKTGTSRPVLQVGQDAIRGAAWDPWSRVLALSVLPSGVPLSGAQVLLANVDGRAAGRLTLPFTGAGRLEWSPWTGTSLGITRITATGTQAWVAALPALPPDPGASLQQ